MDLIKPVYLRDREIQCGSTRISDFDLSMSVTKSISDLTCVQKDRDLWRIYVKSKESRSKILTEGIDIRNTNVKVYDTNPYSAGLNDPSDNVIKITVKGVPLSVDDNEVLNMLKNFNVSFTSDIKYEKIRHPVTRKMTSILNGNRFIYVKALDEGVFLPRTSTCAGLRCSIYHHGQPSTKHNPVAPTAGRIHTLLEIVLTIKDAKFANMRVIYQATNRVNSTLNLKTMCFPSPGVIIVFPISTPVS